MADLLTAGAHQRPDAVALVVSSQSGTTEHSYGELDAASNRLARHLIASGLAQGDTAAVLLPRGRDLVVALHACAKAGIAFCPLDPGQPSARLTHLLSASRAAMLLTDRAGAGAFANVIPALALDAADIRDAVEYRPAAPIAAHDRDTALTPRTVAYVIFTSGSTGAPKGVAVSHGAIAQFIQAFATEIQAVPGQAFVGVTSIAFDPTMLDVFMALSRGMKLILLDDEGRRDPSRIADAVISHSAAVFSATPGVLRALPLEALPAGLMIVCGGEAFPAELLPRMRHFRGIVNAYGPTEASVAATCYHIQRSDNPDAKVPVGRPLAGYHVAIVDEDLRQVPAGTPGELCIGGGALADGYVGEPGQTAAAFLPNPFGEGRIYRTGDLACLRLDGNIELVGRIDEQVKIRGHRVEPSEIEHALRTLFWVADAAVVPHGQVPNIRLAAYIVPWPGFQALPPANIRAALADSLPNWMLPSVYMMLSAIPRTVTGKVDRKALPKIALADSGGALSRASPASSDEALLCGLFARVIGQTEIDADTDFFDAGGDSLAAMILVTELRQLGRELPLSLLVSARTPAAIAATWSGEAVPRGTTMTRPTLFIIPGAGGEHPRLIALCAAWRGILDCVVLDYPDWVVMAARNFTAASLTTHFVQEIAARAGAGPLLLAGYSLGGMAAIAVAKRLARSGQPIVGLFLLDASNSASDASPRSAPWSRRTISSVRTLMDALRARDRTRLAHLIGTGTGYRLSRRPRLLGLVSCVRSLRLPADLRYWLHFSVCSELQIRAYSAQETLIDTPSPGLGSCSVVVFRASELGRTSTPESIPESLCRHVAIETVAGDHFSLLEKRSPQSVYAKLPHALRAILDATVQREPVAAV